MKIDWFIIQEFQFIVDKDEDTSMTSSVKETSVKKEDVGLKLIGMKYLFPKDKMSSKINFVPLFESENC